MRFPMLDALCKLFIILTVGLLEKICILLYLLLPMGVFMLLMQLRDKNNKTTAISTFTTDNSEFQFIFPGYILVAVEPNTIKNWFKKKVRDMENFINKYKGVLLLLVFLTLLAVASVPILLHYIR